jgi:hypothetical protein
LGGMARTHLEAIKSRSEARLRDLGACIGSNLPLIEDLDEVAPRSARDAAGRACALGYVIGIGFRADRTELQNFIRRFHLDEWVSRNERALLQAPSPSEQDLINCMWLTECVQALGWALGLVALDPLHRCDDDLAQHFPLREDPATFISAARLRPLSEIQAEVDFHYRLHWWVRHCQLTDSKCNFESSIVVERRRALDWLYGVDPDWDEIPLDT